MKWQFRHKNRKCFEIRKFHSEDAQRVSDQQMLKWMDGWVDEVVGSSVLDV